MKKYIHPMCEINVPDTSDIITNSNDSLIFGTEGYGGVFDFEKDLLQ